MAVPKKRTGHSAQGKRRSNWKATSPEVTKCSHCGEPVLAHTVCTACGYYKDKAVSIKSPDYVDETEAKKPAKKTTAKKTTAKKTTAKKTTKKAETAETEVKAEETKVEKAEEKTEE
ncbi:50S ribosomal protein L32 [bacterium]|nr:50S ribosomal protein L32 [bacterium]